MPVQPVSELIYRSYRDQYAVREANEKLAKRASRRLVEQEGVLYRELAFYSHQARLVERESARRAWRTQPLARYRSSARRLLVEPRPELSLENEKPERKSLPQLKDEKPKAAPERRPNFSFCFLPVPPPEPKQSDSAASKSASDNASDSQREEEQRVHCKYAVHEGQCCRYYPCTPTPATAADSERVLRSTAGSRRSLVETLSSEQRHLEGSAAVAADASDEIQQVGRELLARQDQLRLAMALRRRALFALRGSSAPESLEKHSFGKGSHTAKRAAKRSGLLLLLDSNSFNLSKIK